VSQAGALLRQDAMELNRAPMAPLIASTPAMMKTATNAMTVTIGEDFEVSVRTNGSSPPASSRRR